MTDRNLSWFYSALVISLIVHLMAADPISKWLDRSILPVVSEESIEIDLSELREEQPMLEQPSEPPPEETVEQIPLPEMAPPQPAEIPDKPVKPLREKKIFLNPTKKKVLNETAEKDIVVDQHDTEPPPAPAPDPKTEEETGKAVEKPFVPEKDDKTRFDSPPSETSQAKVSSAKESDLAEVIEPPDKEIVSPLFITKPDLKETTETKNTEKEKSIPQEIKDTFRGETPEPTASENLEFSMNTYQWTFKRYMENWAVDIQKWWKAPLDYKYGKVPEGGDMWIQVKLARSGRLLGYRIVQSSVTAEMELAVIQALIGSLKQPAMPASFPKDELILNWRFIYPPIRPEIDLRRRPN